MIFCLKELLAENFKDWFKTLRFSLKIDLILQFQPAVHNEAFADFHFDEEDGGRF